MNIKEIRIPKDCPTQVFIEIDETLKIEPRSQIFVSKRLFDYLKLMDGVETPNYGRTPPYDEYNETWLEWKADERRKYRASFVNFSLTDMRVLNFSSREEDYYACRREANRFVSIDFM